MRVLLDNNVNQDFASLLTGHEVVHCRSMGWGELVNGKLLAMAVEHGFDVMITADKQMRFQQPSRKMGVAVIVLNSLYIRWDSIAPLAPAVQFLLDSDTMALGEFYLVGS